MLSFYTEDEVVKLRVLKDTERDIESRMPVKLTRHYYELAKRSKPIQRIVKADPDETNDMTGSEDPGNQMDYSPVEGLLHKYEMGLMYVVSTCSAHCRFCYREELIARKEIERQDGTKAKKGLAKIPAVVAYIKEFNEKVEANGGRHPDCGREKLREILLSGGDPMVLNNAKLAAWFGALAEAGIESIRVGTKEMAFYPNGLTTPSSPCSTGSTRPIPRLACTSCCTSSTLMKSWPKTTTGTTSRTTTASCSGCLRPEKPCGASHLVAG